MLKIHISGASGFVGQNLCQYLKNEGLELQTLQLRTVFDDSILEGADVIVHLAGKAHDLKNISGFKEYYKVNLELTKRIYNAFLWSDAKKFIFISSVKAVADHVDFPLTENHLPEPMTHYGKSKLMAEEYIQKQPLPVGKAYYILRPCMIHGPGNKGNLNLLYKIAHTGLPYPLAAFQNERSFLTVENLCFVMKELMKRTDIPAGVYNVADNTPLSTNRVMEIMGEELCRKTRFLRINKSIINAVAKLGDIFPLPLNSERLNKLTENYIVSNRKILNALNKPLPLDSESGLRKTIKSFIHGC